MGLKPKCQFCGKLISSDQGVWLCQKHGGKD